MIETILSRMSLEDHRSLDQRRVAFLQQCLYVLGPTQLEHLTRHADQVSETAVRLAKLLRIDDQQIHQIQDAALLHDIGKCMIPEAVLAIPGSLTIQQCQLMAIHPELGAWIAFRLGADDPIIAMIRHHHTRYDQHRATGHPQCQAPLGARVVCVADAFVTMTTNRPYQPARTGDQAMVELRRQRGAQFDPQVVDAAQQLSPSVLNRAA